MKILIKYATRGRPEWFKKAVENIYNTIDATDFKLLVSADVDDPTMNCEDIKCFMLGRPNSVIKYDESISKIDAINRDMEITGAWDLLINHSDDMKFIVKGWDTKMIDSIKRRWVTTDFFAHFSDGVVHERLTTMSIIGREYYERDGYIYHPSYKSFSCDAEAMYVAQMRKCYHYFPEVYYNHIHTSAGGLPYDETYRINSLASDYDTANYFRRLNNYFDEPHDKDTPIPYQEHIRK